MPDPQNHWSRMQLHCTSSQSVCHSCRCLLHQSSSAHAFTSHLLPTQAYTNAAELDTHSRSNTCSASSNGPPRASLGSHLQTVKAMLSPEPKPVPSKRPKRC